MYLDWLLNFVSFDIVKDLNLIMSRHRTALRLFGENLRNEDSHNIKYFTDAIYKNNDFCGFLLARICVSLITINFESFCRTHHVDGVINLDEWIDRSRASLDAALLAKRIFDISNEEFFQIIQDVSRVLNLSIDNILFLNQFLKK